MKDQPQPVQAAFGIVIAFFFLVIIGIVLFAIAV
jgi:hypothetical protein